MSKFKSPPAHALRVNQPSAMTSGKIEVDRQSGRVRNVAILSPGQADGYKFDASGRAESYGFAVDETMVRQAKAGLQKAQQLRVHLTHSHREGGLLAPPADPLLTRIGYVDGGTAHIESGVLRADLVIPSFARHSPAGNGNDLREFIFGMAEESPTDFGTSIVFEPDKFESRVDSTTKQSLPPAGRIKRLVSVDLVGDPAANPTGLLSQPATVPYLKEEDKNVDELMKQHLHALGMPADATDEQALAFLRTLAPKTEVRAEAKALNTPPAESPSQPFAPGPDAIALAKHEAVALERQRVAEITGLSERLRLGPEWTQKQITASTSIADARLLAADEVAKKYGQLIGMGQPHVTDQRASLRPAMQDAILLRAGAWPQAKEGQPAPKPHDRAERFRGLTLIEMGRAWFQEHGVPDVHTLSRTRIAELFGRQKFADTYGSVGLAQSTGDFGSVLADTINKSLRQAYLDAPRTWNLWARRTTAPDFKQITRAALSDSPTPTVKTVGKSIDYSTLSDSKEQYQLAEYASGIILTRQAVVNDDLDAFGRIPSLQASACARLEDDLAYGILTANANLADGLALFSTGANTHLNLVSTGTAITVNNIADTEKLMMVQTGPKGARLDLRAKFLIVPAAKYRIAQQLADSAVDPNKNNAAVNPYFTDQLRVIGSARLDAASATAWYLVADNSQVDTVEVCFLADQPEPLFQQETQFDTLDVKFAVIHTAAAKAIDYRGMCKNNGA